MPEQVEMERNIYRLKCEQEELEDSYRRMVHRQEDEDESLIYIRQGMEREYDNYGQKIRKLAVLLEEENELLSQFRVTKNELEEEIYYKHKKDCEKIEEELYELHRQIRCAEDEPQEGEKKHADK